MPPKALYSDESEYKAAGIMPTTAGQQRMAYIKDYLPQQSFRYLDSVAMLWIAMLVTINLTSQKLISIGPLLTAGSIVYYPFCYVFSDVFTEVYGYKKSRRVIWTGCLAMLIVNLCVYLLVVLPPAALYSDNAAFVTTFAQTWRITVAGYAAYVVGEFTNAFVLAKMKLWSNGRWLWARAIGSTMAGMALDQTLYVLIAFAPFYPWADIITMIISQWLFCVVWEILMLPVTYRVVRWLKRAEGLDIYDRGTNFNPLHWRG
jgi:queuosine precursor transporter